MTAGTTAAKAGAAGFLRSVANEVGRHGTVQIDEPRHLQELKHSPARGHGLEVQIESPALSIPGAEGRDCETCGFSAWGWQTTCPRCGETLS